MKAGILTILLTVLMLTMKAQSLQSHMVVRVELKRYYFPALAEKIDYVPSAVRQERAMRVYFSGVLEGDIGSYVQDVHTTEYIMHGVVSFENAQWNNSKTGVVFGEVLSVDETIRPEWNGSILVDLYADGVERYPRFSRKPEFDDHFQLRINLDPSLRNDHMILNTMSKTQARLMVGYSVGCSEFWYGSQCAKYCKPERSASVKYSCTSIGDKVCRRAGLDPLNDCKPRTEG